MFSLGTCSSLGWRQDNELGGPLVQKFGHPSDLRLSGNGGCWLSSWNRMRYWALMLFWLEGMATQHGWAMRVSCCRSHEIHRLCLVLLGTSTLCMGEAISPDHHNTSWCLFSYLGDNTWPPYLPCTQEPVTGWAAFILVPLTWEWCLLPEESNHETLKKVELSSFS